MTQKNKNQDLTEADFQKLIDQIVAKDVEKNSTPLWLTRKFVESPCKVVIIGSIIFVISIVLTILFNTFAMVEQNNREYLIWSNERVKVMDMHTQMQDDFQKSLGDVQIPERSQEEELWSTNVIIECDGCNAFTKEGMKALYEFEQELKNHEDFKKFCFATVDSTECAPNQLLSPTNLSLQVLEKTADKLTDDDIKALKDYIFSDENVFTQVKFLFGIDFSEKSQTTEHIRSYMRFGTPIKIDGTLKNDKFDDRQDQIDEFNDFCLDIIDMRDADRNLPSGMEIYTFSIRLDMLEFAKTVDADFMWALASILFVLTYISFHLKSIFLGGTAMGQILISFPLTQVLFRLVFQITYFSSLHIMAIFIVLGIAADNVFVFVDAWRQTALYKQLDKDPQTRLNQRMAITYRRASRAMLATSSTTSAAFLATGFSTIMPISSFGFFAGILIPVNFLLVVLFFPAILIISETTFGNMGICCCCKKKKQDENTESQQQQELQNQYDQEAQKQQSAQDINERNLPLVERFFAMTFSPFVNRFKFPILVLFAIWVGIASWRTSQMTAITEPEKFLPEDHKSEMAKDKALYAFHPSAQSDTGITLYQFWGVNAIDNDGTSRWDPEDLGKVEYDDNFNLSFEKNQQYFFDYCTKLKENELVQDKNVDSFIFSFKTYAETETTFKKFPVPKDLFMQTLKDYTKKSTAGITYYNQNRIGIMKGELKYVQIKIAANGVPFRPYDELNPLYEQWEELKDKSNKDAPEGLNNSKQTGGFHWTWMITERAFVTNAVQGMLISLAFGLIVLLATTHNVIMALFSLLSIIGIVVSVVCIMQLSGWELGIAESITIVILIGLSIDYVVHLANHYVESVYPDRHRKIKVALRDLGISIVSGAITTVGAGVFLLFATVIIFNKFAILILSTIFFSLIFALFFFSACMHAFGPENECGSILCNKKKEENQQQQLQVEQQQQQQQPEIVVEQEGQEAVKGTSDKQVPVSSAKPEAELQNQSNQDSAKKTDEKSQPIANNNNNENQTESAMLGSYNDDLFAGTNEGDKNIVGEGIQAVIGLQKKI